MDKNKVNSRSPIYDAHQPLRDLFDAVMNGTDGMRKGGKTYLPQYPDEAATDYTARLASATIDGIVAQGVDGFCGKVFHQPIDTSKVNTAIIELLENIDLQGNNLDTFAQNSFKAAFDGYSVILIDAPKAEQPVESEEDAQRQGIRPYWRLYKAKDVLNPMWIVDANTKMTRLARLPLYEKTEEPDGNFGTKSVERIRVYYHWQNENVKVEVWRKSEGTIQGEEWAIEQPAIVLPKLTAIPAAFIGKYEDKPWLLNEARLEIKAYQKESSFDTIEYMSMPSFYTKGWLGGEGDKASLGASVHWKLPIEGDIGYAQIDSAGNAQLKASIDSIKQEIAGKLDAITKEAMPTDQTATEVVSDDSKSQARLIVWAQQLKDALENALMFTGQFMGLGDDKGGEIILMTAWEVAKAQAEEAKKMKAEADKANIAATMAKANNGN